MANFSALLKSEITRLARKEVKASTDPLRKLNTTQRKQIAELRREVAELKKSMRAAGTVAQPAQAPAEGAPVRFSAKGLKSLRARLGLSASDFGKLAGASGQSIYAWETGRTSPRQSQREKIASLRGMGKREALKRLEAL